MLIADGKVLTEKDFIKLDRVEGSSPVGVATGWGGIGFSKFVVRGSKKVNQEVFLFETRKGYRIMTLDDQQLFCKISRQKRCYFLSLGEMDEGFLIRKSWRLPLEQRDGKRCILTIFFPTQRSIRKIFIFWTFPISRNQYRPLTRFLLKAGCVISVSITAGCSSCPLRTDSKGSFSGGISTGHPKRLQIQRK